MVLMNIDGKNGLGLGWGVGVGGGCVYKNTNTAPPIRGRFNK